MTDVRHNHETSSSYIGSDWSVIEEIKEMENYTLLNLPEGELKTWYVSLQHSQKPTLKNYVWVTKQVYDFNDRTCVYNASFRMLAFFS